jgi:hypothetical protein
MSKNKITYLGEVASVFPSGEKERSKPWGLGWLQNGGVVTVQLWGSQVLGSQPGH